MLTGSANFSICKEVRYKSVNFPYYSRLRDSKSARFIRKIVCYNSKSLQRYNKNLIRELK